jgi:hypothetical protein
MPVSKTPRSGKDAESEQDLMPSTVFDHKSPVRFGIPTNIKVGIRPEAHIIAGLEHALLDRYTNIL